MGTKGREIVELDVIELIELLNKAYADEWLAYYQYWVSAQIVKGKMKNAVVSELTEHAGDELKHAEMLSERILQLGGTPITNITELNDRANCKYAEPTNSDSEEILKQGIDGERCAIDVYNKLLDTLRHKDPITYHVILEILEDDFEAILEDIERGGE